LKLSKIWSAKFQTESSMFTDPNLDIRLRLRRRIFL
jgi:hypothetical protein